jgi:hypothetical protein
MQSFSTKTSLKNATWLDTSKLNAFTPRSFGVAAATDNFILTCGTEDGGQTTAMSCDQFDVMWYNSTIIRPANSVNRAGMAAAYQTSSKSTKAYFIGGFNAGQVSGTVDVANIMVGKSSTISWTKIPDMGMLLKYHTATWVDSPVNGVVVLAGFDTSGRSVAGGYVYTPANSSWTGQ